MVITKLNLQPISAESDYSNITIGNSKFTDDIWDLSSYISSKNISYANKVLNFTEINNIDIKEIIKLYMHYKLSKIKPQSVVSKLISLSTFIEYLENSNLVFKELKSEDIYNFIYYLKDKNTISTISNKITTIKEISRIGEIKGWNVPSSKIYLNINFNISDADKRKVKPIPEDIFDKILYYAINKEKDIITKAGIIIQSQTGLRINEVLSLKQGCIRTTSDGYDYMEVLITKTEKDANPTYHKIFINELVKTTINELENCTKELRKETGLNELFLEYSPFSRSKNKIIVYKVKNWGITKIKKFIERWDIRDSKGNLYSLKSHQFRATFVRELIKQKVPIAHIMKQFSHVSLEMTSYYLTLQEEEVKEIYSDMILGKDSKIAGLRAKEIKAKLDEQFRGKTEQEIDNIVSNLSKSMSFNPLPTGVCLYDFRRGNCSDGDGCFFYNCPNYITEVKFYPVLKQELDLIEKEMTRYKELGQQRSWERQYVKYKYLKPLVDSLEVQMNGKEA